MLDIVFALYGIADGLEFLEVDKPLQSISSRKALYEAGPVFEHPADKIIRHADIEDAVRSIGQEVNVATCHVEILQDVDGRDKPGHDDGVRNDGRAQRARAAFLR
jgi:hypothetical protein